MALGKAMMALTLYLSSLLVHHVDQALCSKRLSSHKNCLSLGVWLAVCRWPQALVTFIALDTKHRAPLNVKARKARQASASRTLRYLHEASLTSAGSSASDQPDTGPVTFRAPHTWQGSPISRCSRVSPWLAGSASCLSATMRMSCGRSGARLGMGASSASP